MRTVGTAAQAPATASNNETDVEAEEPEVVLDETDTHMPAPSLAP